MKGIVKYFKIGDIESLFYFYLIFVFLSEIFVIFFFKKLAQTTNSSFDYWTCFFCLLIVPLVETFLLGFITEAFNLIFFKNESLKNNYLFSSLLKKTKIPFIVYFLLLTIIIFLLINMNSIINFLCSSEIVVKTLFIIMLITAITGFLIIFFLKLILSYKLKIRAMNYRIEIEKQKTISQDFLPLL